MTATASERPSLDPAEPAGDAPDACWVLVNRAGESLGGCSLWWRRTPSLPGHRVGIIGHYAARDAAAGRRILRHACEQLALRGCTLAVGPMDGNTWRRYRLVTARGSEPPFFLEPDNPDAWVRHFLDLGFEPVASYRSTLTTDLSRDDPRVEGVADRLSAQGIRIRPLDTRCLQEDLQRIYTVAVTSFRGAFLYTPIEAADFTAQYRPILPAIRSELVLIAEVRDRAIGFLFAVPDVLQARRGQAIDTVILKTLAVLPDRAHAGLGGLLVARGHQIARGLGYTRAIHALMHEANASRNISRHYAQTMRRYALFGRSLRGSS